MDAELCRVCQWPKRMLPHQVSGSSRVLNGSFRPWPSGQSTRSMLRSWGKALPDCGTLSLAPRLPPGNRLLPSYPNVSLERETGPRARPSSHSVFLSVACVGLGCWNPQVPRGTLQSSHQPVPPIPGFLHRQAAVGRERGAFGCPRRHCGDLTQPSGQVNT